MRRRTFFVLCLLCVFFTLRAPAGRAQPDPWSLQVLEADAHHLLLELYLSSFESETVARDGRTYQRLRVDGWGNWGQPGAPQLPMYAVPVGMPHLGTPQVSVVEAESETMSGYRPYPAPTLELGGTEGDPQIVEAFLLDADAYDADAFFPGPLAEAASVGLLRDQPLFQLRLYPFQYNPQQGELRVYRRMRVRVDLPEAGLAPAEVGRAEPSPAFERILQRALLNYDVLPSPAIAPPPPDDDGPILPLDARPQVKLMVEEEGLYRVTYADLQAVSPELAQTDPRLLELSNRGSAVPILFQGQEDGSFDPGDSLLFYGQAIDSDYVRQNVYWLKAGDAPGLRMAQRDGTPGAGSTPSAFADTRHYEQDLVYWRAAPEGVDHWFWDDLSVSGSTPVSAEYVFELRHIAASGPDGELRLALQGANYSSHLTQVYLNGTALLSGSEGSWSGQAEKLYAISVPQSLFVEGTNRLRVENILPGGTSSSDVYVNGFEVTYQDTYVAEDDHLLFAAPAAGTYAFELTGLTTDAIELLDVTDPATPARIVDAAVETAVGGYRLRFSDSASADQRYLAQGTDALPTPAIQLDEPSTWRAAANGATYLIIAHPSLYDAVQPLAAYRSGRGETVATAKTEDVYDEFNDGVGDPQAVRSFLEYAYQNWSPRPVYVLLVGDASVDPKNNLGSSLPDLLPVHYVDTPIWGQTPNDGWYAQVHGDDDYPDLIVGRIPARNGSDVSTMVSKMQTYEESPPAGDWVWRAVLVADDGDSAFRQDMDTIAGMLPAGMVPVQMYDYDPDTSVREEVSAGALILAYSGHGRATGTGWGGWSGERIFDQPEMQDLENGSKLPFMTVANCLSGWFDQHDQARAMAEEFLLLDNKGGIASWAPASYGFPTSNSVILEQLYQALLVDGDLTLGSAATSARIQAYLQRPDLAASNLFDAFVYLGDPAVCLDMPATLALEGEASPSPALIGERLTYTLTYTVSDAGQARGLTLVHTLPQEVLYESASPPPSAMDACTLTWSLGDTLAGSYTAVITSRVKPDLVHGQTLQAQAHLYDAIVGDCTMAFETTVHDSPIAGLAASNDGPTELGDVTTLTVTTTSGTNVVYTWDLGDGSPPETGSSVQHTYPAVGTYTAWVTAANSVGSRTRSTTVTIVYIPPAASFISSSPDRIGQTTAFQNTSMGTDLTCEWDFGDGSEPVISQEPVMTHTYASVGSFAVVLTATNDMGSDVATGVVEILEQVIAPVASFTSSSPDVLGETTTFVHTGHNGGEDEDKVSYAWDFGDGSSSTARHATHTYGATGAYLVSLTVTNSVGSDTFDGNVRITDAHGSEIFIFLPLIFKP